MLRRIGPATDSSAWLRQGTAASIIVNVRGRDMHRAAQTDPIAPQPTGQGIWRRVWKLLRAAAIAYLLILLVDDVARNNV